jgi:N-acetylneuraminate synthase
MAYIVAEIGINHNGDRQRAIALIEAARECGCDAVKFQKRTVEVVYTAEELRQERPNPFGQTNGDLKRGLEFGADVYAHLFRCAAHAGIDCFASVWDQESLEFMEQFSPPYHKIPSPLITDEALLRDCRQTGRALVLSTGMSSIQQIDRAVNVVGKDNLVLLHCKSAYPCPLYAVNLRAIETLKQRYGCSVGYSGHEMGIWPSIGAVALGCTMVERHFTLSRSDWGSDQSFSLEPREMAEFVKVARELEASLGTGELGLAECEVAAMQKLRRIL